MPPGTARAMSNGRHWAQYNPAFHPPPVSAMSHKQPTGLAAMPTGRSRQAPHFEGKSDEILSEFLHEYEDLADGNGLSEKLEVESIRHYVPRSLLNLWTTLLGYRAADWLHFRAQLEELYPDVTASTRCTCQGLIEFVDLSAQRRIRDSDENDVLKYYRNFLTIALPLLEDNKITDDDFKAQFFFKGVHPDDQRHSYRPSLQHDPLSPGEPAVRFPRCPFGCAPILRRRSIPQAPAATDPKRPPRPALEDPSGRPREAHSTTVRRQSRAQALGA